MKKTVLAVILALFIAAAFATQTSAACGSGGTPCPNDVVVVGGGGK